MNTRLQTKRKTTVRRLSRHCGPRANFWRTLAKKGEESEIISSPVFIARLCCDNLRKLITLWCQRRNIKKKVTYIEKLKVTPPRQGV